MKKSVSLATIFVSFLAWAVACTPESTPDPSAEVQVISITESELVTGQITQIKTFDQCNSSSVFRTEVQFSDSNVQTSQQGLDIGAEISGGGKIPGAVELELKGSIEKHFSETQQQDQTRGGSASIEIPAHTKQEYTIIWKEIRRNGVIEYLEDGQTKSTEYSYRVGIELDSATGKDIPCDGGVLPASTPLADSFTLTISKPDPNKVAAGITSLWDDNNLHVRDILSPGKQSYSGTARVGAEYLFPVYWCATTESVLADNRSNMQTEFYLNGTQIPETLVLVYGYKDKDGWRCINTATLLSGWTAGTEYKLKVIREFKSSLYDGKTTYPAGTYIYELNILAQ